MTEKKCSHISFEYFNAVVYAIQAGATATNDRAHEQIVHVWKAGEQQQSTWDLPQQLKPLLLLHFKVAGRYYIS
jgi:hypothetical protein